MNGKFIEFYISDLHFINSFEDADVSSVPALLRRRMSKLDKCAVSVLNKTFKNEVENIIFSSKTGEVERLLKLIEQYNLEKEVSPNVFSGSVHNYPIGFFLLNSKKAIPYNALSSGGSSISAGLLNSVISKYDITTFCFAEPKNEDYIALSMNIGKKNIKSSTKYRLYIQNSDRIEDDFNEYIELFNGNINVLKTPFFVVERVYGNN